MKLSVLALLCALALGGRVTASQHERPNFLFLITDDQRNDALGCAGHPVLETPVIDRIASRGIRFENAFVTTPICAASRASLLTGTWERRHGYNFGTAPLSEKLIAESYPALLKDAGYRTGFVGKYGVRAAEDAPSVMFDFFRSYGQPFLKAQPDGSLRHLTDIAGDDAAEFLEGYDGTQPFCLTVSFNAPHAEDANLENQFPTSPQEDGLYLDAKLPPPLVATDFWQGLPDFFARSLNRVRWFWRWDTPEKLDRNMRDYYRMISGIDRVTGRILADLERRGLSENTIVIFTSDNGYFMGSRGFAGKWSHYEESLRVPLVIHDPRDDENPGGRLAQELVLNVDLAPTILDLAGLEVPANHEGVSLAPLMRGSAVTDWRKEFLFEHLLDDARIPRMEGVRGTQHVYARYFDNLPEGEFLHDLERDPLQLVNLAGEPGQAELLEGMRERCDELAAASGPAPGLSKGLFQTPPRSARPMVLWPWLNGHVDRRQLTHELEEMRAKGLRGPIIWDIGSLADPDGTIPTGPAFLGEDSLDSIHHALDEAERVGLEVGLVASSSWNAGGAWIGPEHASKELRWAERLVSGPVSFSDAPPLPDDLGAPFGEVALLAIPGEENEARDQGPLDLAGMVDGTGRLSWEVPPGEWKILRFVSCGTDQPLVCPSPASNGRVVDHMSAAATDHHFEVILERLFPDGEDPGALGLMMLDSFEVWEATDWTPGFADEFRAAYGYDPLPYLPVLAGVGQGRGQETTERFLQDYRALVSRLMTSNHFARAAAILEERGLDLLAEAGHGGFPRVGPLEALGVTQIPMGEFWNGMQFWVTKEAASAAHIYGRRDVAAEAMTGWRHWRDGPQEYKRLFDLAFCAGLNRPVFHTFAHNPPEAGKPGFAYHAGEHFNVNSTWWDRAGPFVEYLSRCSHLLRQGRFVADVCFYYGDQAPNLVPARRIDPKVPHPHDEGECQHCGRPMPNRVETLGAGYDYDYVNRDIVERHMQVRDGRLVLTSGMEYRMIVLADREGIALPVLRRLEELVRAGATLVGRPPLRANSLQGYPQCDDEVRRLSLLLWGDDDGTLVRRHGKGQVFRPVALRDVLADMGVQPDFSAETSGEHNLDYIHRRTESEEIYLVVNSADEPVDAECSFRVRKGLQPFLWNAEDGSVLPCAAYRNESGTIRVPLRLPAVSSIFVVFRPTTVADPVVDVRRDGGLGHALDIRSRTSTKARIRTREAGLYTLTTAKGRSGTAEVPEPADDLALAGPWTLTFPAGPEGQGAPASLLLAELESWPLLEDPAARTFSGTASYRTSFELPDGYPGPDHVVHLDLGEVAEVARVSLNGTPLGVLWNPPYRVDVTRRLRPGANELEVEVTNLWHNRIVGDLRAPDEGVHARTNLKHKFRADMELLPSGLLGPVTLRTSVELDVLLR